MKKIRFDFTGGMPLDSDDFEFLLNSIYSAIGNVGIGLAGTHAEPVVGSFSPTENGVFVILRGGTMSYVGSPASGTISWLKGWALWKGELREIRPGSVAVTWGSITGLLWTEAFEATGTETYEDGSVKDTYRDEYLTITATTAPLGPSVIKAWTNTASTGEQTKYFISDRIAEQVYIKLKDYVATKGEPFVSVTPGVNWAATGIANGLSYRKNMDGTVTVVGTVQLVGSPATIEGAAAIVATGLPKLLDFNSPSIAALFDSCNAFEGISGTTQRSVCVRIDTTGTLTYFGDSAVPGGVFVLHVNFNYPYNPLI
jgi:hypothetical protein